MSYEAKYSYNNEKKYKNEQSETYAVGAYYSASPQYIKTTVCTVIQ